MLKIPNSINKVKCQDDTKQSIHGILLDKANQKIVATNGNSLVALVPNEPIEYEQIINFPKISGKILNYETTSHKVTNDKGLSTQGAFVDATYPDWKRVVSDKKPTVSIGISLELLVNVVQTLLDARERDKGRYKISDTIFRLDIVDINTPFKVSAPGNDSFGIIMPARFE